MRYYKIEFTPASGKSAPNIDNFPMVYQSTYTPDQVINTFAGSGVNNPGALEIEFSISLSAADEQTPSSHLCIYNPPIEVIRNADLYQGMSVQVTAGFNWTSGSAFELVRDEFPKSPILHGTVYMSFANWYGTDQAIDLYIGVLAASNT